MSRWAFGVALLCPGLAWAEPGLASAGLLPVVIGGVGAVFWGAVGAWVARRLVRGEPARIRRATWIGALSAGGGWLILGAPLSVAIVRILTSGRTM